MAEHDVTVADGETIVAVNEIIIHEKWFEADDFTYNYDVCLLKTNDLGINGDTVDFACLPNQGEHVLPTFRLEILILKIITIIKKKLDWKVRNQKLVFQLIDAMSPDGDLSN